METISKMKRFYFENFILCGFCNGTGLRDYMDYCRCCNATGIESLSEFMSHTTGDVLSLTILYYQSKKLLKP